MTELVDLGKLADVLRAAAECIGKLGDSIAQIIQLGDSAFSVAQARRTETHLKSLYKNLVNYWIGQTKSWRVRLSAQRTKL